MLSIANSFKVKPKEMNLKDFVENSHKLVEIIDDEIDWYKKISEYAKNWYKIN